ncbi:MAG: NHLP bacteriocin export ABC transporter permease/ATPase subunit [Blautia sp.]|jgi:NHLM bacteriocin system ABC transporter ATP-binding protein
MNEVILKGGQVILTEDLSTYLVVSGTALVYAAVKKGSETGRRYFLTEMLEGERIPSMQHTDEDGNWVFVISALGEARIQKLPGIEEDTYLSFAKKISMFMMDCNHFGEDVVEVVNLRLITEEGFIYAVSEEQEKTKEKGLTLIYNMFYKKSRSARADKSGNSLYDTMAFICAKKRIRIASFEDMKEACGRRFDVEDVSRVSHFASRKVLLEENWFVNDSGILLVFDEEKNTPYAAVPKGFSKYYLHDCVQGTVEPLTEEIAKKLKPVAYMVYRPFPNKKLGVMDLIKFGIPSIKGADLFNLFFMAAVSALIGLLLPYMNQKIFDEYIPMGDQSTLIQMSVLILSFTVGNLLFTMIKNLAIFRSTNACEYDVQAAVFDRLYNLPSSFFNDYDSGDLGQRVMGISAIYNLLSDVAVNTVLTATFSLFYLYRMFKYSGKLAKMGLVLILINAAVTAVIGFIQIRYEKELMEVKAKVSSLMYQILNGISKIKIAGVENRALLQYLEPYTESKKILIKKSRLDNISSNLNLVLNTVFTVVFYYQMIAKDLGISFGEYMAFTSAFGYFANAVVSMVSAFLEVNHAIPTYRRAQPVLETLPEFEDDTIMPGKLEGNVEVNNVSFKYTPEGENIITNLSVKIHKGEYVGIVGSSGSGKSTLLKLLLGFEKPTKGKIYYDDRDIDSLDKRELRKKFGVVLQDGQMISGTIYENIMITSSQVSEKRVHQIIKMVGLEDDIAQMPMGIHTVIAEGSGTISGGQRQRILIARAIANNPKILYFDEATSALDNVNQALVCESLEKLHATRVVVAHRLSTVMNCDRILVLEHGQLIEQGSYEQLMEQRGRFYELASRQMV